MQNRCRELPTLQAEERFWGRGLRRVAGLDEVGRGAWAGPVYAGAVILPQDSKVCEYLSGVRDSKQLSPAQRESLAERIVRAAAAVGVGRGEQQEIDALGIVARDTAGDAARSGVLVIAPQALVIDAPPLPDVICLKMFPLRGCASSPLRRQALLRKSRGIAGWWRWRMSISLAMVSRSTRGMERGAIR